MKKPKKEPKLEYWMIRLTKLREAKDLNKTELAKLSGVSQEQISQLENGKRPFTQKTLDKLLKALGADYDQFFVKSRQPVVNIDYKKWNNDLRKIRKLEKKLKEQNKLIDYEKKNCTVKTCVIMKRLNKRSA